MSVESLHLDLADMLAEVSGDTAGEQTRAHLFVCADCRAETRGWAAVAGGVRYLAADLRVAAGASPEPVPSRPHHPIRAHHPLRLHYPPRQYPQFRLGRRELMATVAGAAVVVALLVILLPGHARLTRPLHTEWHAAHAVPSAAVAGPHASAGGWRLAGYLVSTGWSQNTAGPEPGNLTCPTAETCYVEGDNATSASGPADMDSFYVSHSGGLSWSVLPVPSGLTFSSALSCGSAVDCAAGGLYNGQPVFVRTVDGGHSWTVDPLPAAADDMIFQLSCPTTTTCEGLLTTSQSQLPPSQQYYGGVTFLRTSDGGRHFSTSAFPAGQSMQALSCATTSDCVAIGVSSTDTAASDAEQGFAQTTTDGGATWTQGIFPSGFSPGPFSDVTCPDAQHCYMLGTTNPNTGYGAVAMSADGGRTWTPRPVPRAIPQPFLDTISCPTASTCYVSGTEAVAQRFADGAVNEGSAMILTTSNAGLDWGRVMFALPARVPAGIQYDAFMQIGGIQCPRVGTCVALSASDQGSRSTPVYTDGIAP
jgi:photosystem II stability/assembly factor-like uncharacterized protein